MGIHVRQWMLSVEGAYANNCLQNCSVSDSQKQSKHNTNEHRSNSPHGKEDISLLLNMSKQKDMFTESIFKEVVPEENTYFPFLHKHSMAGFMTEFGAVKGNRNEMKHITSHLASTVPGSHETCPLASICFSDLLHAADKHFQSWTYWQLKKFDDFTTAPCHSSKVGAAEA